MTATDDLLARADMILGFLNHAQAAVLIRDLAASLRTTETQRDAALNALQEAVDWMDSPGGDPTSEMLLARWRRILDSQPAEAETLAGREQNPDG